LFEVHANHLRFFVIFTCDLIVSAVAKDRVIGEKQMKKLEVQRYVGYTILAIFFVAVNLCCIHKPSLTKRAGERTAFPIMVATACSDVDVRTEVNTAGMNRLRGGRLIQWRFLARRVNFGIEPLK
jgi:hypothetical protein